MRHTSSALHKLRESSFRLPSALVTLNPQVRGGYIHMTDIMDQKLPPVERKFDAAYTENKNWTSPLANTHPVPGLPRCHSRSPRTPPSSADGRVRSLSLNVSPLGIGSPYVRGDAEWKDAEAEEGGGGRGICERERASHVAQGSAQVEVTPFLCTLYLHIQQCHQSVCRGKGLKNRGVWIPPPTINNFRADVDSAAKTYLFYKKELYFG